jgi:hypothetical protein
MQTWALGIEASTVIAMRTAKLAAGGPAARKEADRMVREKINSAQILQARALSGNLGANPAAAAGNTIAHYRRKVTANRRRLQK